MLSHIIASPKYLPARSDNQTVCVLERRTLDDFMQSFGATTVRGRDDIVFHEGQPCLKLYRVTTGAVRICRFRRDGTRQIEAFYLPGDYFGFDINEEARFTAEATADTSLLAADSVSLRAVQASAQAVGAAIWKLALNELYRSHDHSFVLCYRHAQDRVFAFLEEMVVRLQRISCIDLPMSRQDIADYLGLTIESVSRSFTDLARTGVITMPQPRTVILNSAMRAQFAGPSGPSTVADYSTLSSSRAN